MRGSFSIQPATAWCLSKCRRPVSIHSAQATKIPRRFISRSSPSHFPARSFTAVRPCDRQRNGSGGALAMPGRARGSGQSSVLHASDTFLPALSRRRLGNFNDPTARRARRVRRFPDRRGPRRLHRQCAAARVSRRSIAIWRSRTRCSIAAAAQSMISGYRGNNGSARVTVDPELMRLAAAQAQVMAAHDKMATISGGRSRSASAIRSSAAASRSRTFPPATTRWRKRFPAGAIRRRTAPICSIPASRGWASPRSMRRARSTRCSGR